MNRTLSQAIPLSPLLGRLPLAIVGLHGRARGGTANLTGVYLGDGQNRAFLEGLFFTGATATPLATRRLPLLAGGGLRQAWRGADVCLLDLPPLWSRFPGCPAVELSLPAWIAQIVRLPGTPRGADQWPLPAAAGKEVSRHVRRRGFTLRWSSDSGTVRAFYHDFYRPHLVRRFGDTAQVCEESRFMALARGMDLALLYRGSTVVAGVLVAFQRRGLRLGWYGTRDGCPERGASEALDGLVLRHAWMLGLRTVHMGNTRPCMSDGVFRYKARLGAIAGPTRFPQARLGVALPGMNPDALRCLREQPLLTTQGAGMAVCCAVDAPQPGHPWYRLEQLDHGE